MVGKAWWQECEADHITPTVRKQREEREMPVLSSFPFYSDYEPNIWSGAARVLGGLPFSINLLETLLQMYPEVCSMVILSPVKLIMKINHCVLSEHRLWPGTPVGVGMVFSESGGREVSMIGNLKVCFNFYLCVSPCVSFMCVWVHTETRKWHQVFWSCSYGQLSTAWYGCWKPNSSPLEYSMSS